MARLRLRRACVRCLLAGLIFAFVSALAAPPLPDAVLDTLRHRDYRQAIELLRPLVEQGDSEAQYQLGRLYQRGLGVKQSEQQALEYFELAGAAGHVESAYLVGTFYERGGVVGRDGQLAAHWLKIAADAGHELAQRRLRQLDGDQTAATTEPAQVEPVTSRGAPGRLAVCAAAQAQDMTALNRLINAGADVRARDANGASALHCGVRSGSVAVVRRMLDAGAPVRVADASGDTPLHLAVASGSMPLTRLLLKAGADAQAMNASKWSPRMLAERGGDAAMKKLLGVESGARQATLARLDVAAKSSGKAAWSKLALASWSGEVDLVRSLIKQGADIEEVDRSGHTPAYRAVQANRRDVLQLLVDHGADLAESSAEGTLLHVALRAGHNDVAGILLASKPLQNVADSQGETPLLLAIRLENPAAAEMLLARGADANAGGIPPLVVAARYGLAPTVQLLLDAGANPDAVDSLGRSALWWAARSDALDIARGLLGGGALNLADNEGVAPWHVAARSDNPAMLELLAPSVADLNIPTASGSTALLLAAETGNLPVVESLLARKAKVDVKNKVGDTALICAVRNGHKPVAAKLIGSGANPRMRNAQNMSAMELAERSSDKEWVEILKDKRGWIDVLMTDA